MWCSVCQQDVPGVAVSASDTTPRCVRCGGEFEAAGPTHFGRRVATKSVRNDISSEETPTFFDFEDWELDAVIEDADRMMRRIRLSQPEAESKDSTRTESSNLLGQTSLDNGPSGTVVPSSLTRPHRPESSVPWLISAVGLALFVCGSVLAGWALLAHRPELWRVGLPLVFGGQMTVLAGLIWQLESVWLSNRATSQAMHGLDEQVRQLQRTPLSSEMLHQRDGLEFHRHSAESTEPHASLANLRRQLDSLQAELARVPHQPSS